MISRVLVVIDMQNDLITGTLGNQDAQNIVMNVVKRIDQAANHPSPKGQCRLVKI